MRDFKLIPTINNVPLFIDVKAVSKESETANSTSGPFTLPYHVLGVVTSGSGTIQRCDNIYHFKTTFKDSSIIMRLNKQGEKEIELYNTDKDLSFSNKKNLLPTNNGTVGIYSHDMSLYIKNFKITLNDETVNNKNISYSSPAITAEVGKKYYFKDYTFKFSEKGAAINGNLINWRGDDGITIKNGSFTIKSKGVSTLFAEYNGRVKKFFVVTERDSDGNFVLFNFNFKDWYSENNPFVIEQFADRLPLNDLELINEGPFKDFLYINNHVIPFVIKLNSDTVKHFSNYTLSAEMFTDDTNTLAWKRMGFLARLIQKNKSIRKSVFCAATYTKAPGAAITISNYKILTTPNSYTCTSEELSRFAIPDEIYANNIARADSGLCFFLPKGTTQYFKANEGTSWKYSWIGFDTNIEIPDFAQKKFFVLPGADALFDKAQKSTKNEELFDVTYKLFNLIKSGPAEGAATNLSVSQKVKMLVGQMAYTEITVPNIAEKVNLSCNYLSTVFKKETGQTLQSYILDHKLTESKRSLAVEGATILSVSENFGYKDPDSYIFAFKKRFGQTPTQYLKTLKRQ